MLPETNKYLLNSFYLGLFLKLVMLTFKKTELEEY